MDLTCIEIILLNFSLMPRNLRIISFLTDSVLPCEITAFYAYIASLLTPLLLSLFSCLLLSVNNIICTDFLILWKASNVKCKHECQVNKSAKKNSFALFYHKLPHFQGLWFPGNWLETEQVKITSLWLSAKQKRWLLTSGWKKTATKATTGTCTVTWTVILCKTRG